MGKPPDYDVKRNFQLTSKAKPPEFKKDKYTCRSCGKHYADNTNRMKKHLQECKAYLDNAKVLGIDNPITRAAETKTGISKQTTINFPRLNRQEKLRLDMKCAAFCYEEGLSFSFLESDAMREFCHDERMNPAYQPPSRKYVSGRLLNHVYREWKAKVETILAELPFLNIIVDESTNINGVRINNISIHSDMGSFYYLSQDIGALSMTAINEANWLRDHLRQICDGNFDRINSIATDTCNVQYAMWKIIEEFPELRHCFFVPCDSHGIQLIIKDLLQLPYYKSIHDKVQIIVKAFKNAPLQLARLRICQIQLYGKKKALVLSIITRWGTNYRQADSVYINKDALRLYASRPEFAEKLSSDALQYIMDPMFWVQLDELRDLLQPIDKALKMSESDRANLGRVVPRWEEIHTHLNHLKMKSSDLAEYMKLDGPFSERFKRQVLPIHYAAFYLTPENFRVSLDGAEDKLFDFFLRYSKSSEDARILRMQFMSFRNQEAPFQPTRWCWEHIDDPRTFWKMISTEDANFLKPLAMRIWATPANSVPSERAFSIQNFIHTKLRNCLHPKRVDKLIYIYMNSRVLKRKQKSPYLLTDEEQVQEENLALVLDGAITAEELELSETWAVQDDDNDSESESDDE